MIIQFDFDDAHFATIVKTAVAEVIAEKSVQNQPLAPKRRILHSMQELADFLDCSKVTAQKLKNEGKIPYKQMGRKVLFDTADILNAMHSEKRRFRH